MARISHCAERVGVLRRRLLLLLENAVRAPLRIRIEHEHVRFEVIQRLLAANERVDLHGRVGIEGDEVETAERSRILILPTYRLLENVDFDVARVAGQLRAIDEATLIRVERGEQTDGETAARSHARTGRHVANRRDFERFVDFGQPQGLANQFVLNVVDFLRDFDARVGQSKIRFEAGMHVDVHVPIDRRAENGAVFVVAKRG